MLNCQREFGSAARLIWLTTLHQAKVALRYRAVKAGAESADGGALTLARPLAF